jgi:glycosyltransferase involved in cell wall biosynthesis
MSASRNLGVANATAPYVAFLDADDVWMPDNLAAQIQLLKNMPDVAMIVGTPEYWHSWDRTSTKHDRTVLPGGMAERRLDPPEAVLALHPLGAHPGVGVIGLVRRDAFDAIGGFEPRFRGLFEDQVFRAKICLRYPVYITSRSGYRYRQHAASCCARTSMKEYMRLRATYLDWFEEDRERVKDPRVRTAVRRARLKRPYLMFRRLIVDSLPSGFKERVQDILAT